VWWSDLDGRLMLMRRDVTVFVPEAEPGQAASRGALSTETCAAAIACQETRNVSNSEGGWTEQALKSQYSGLFGVLGFIRGVSMAVVTSGAPTRSPSRWLSPKSLEEIRKVVEEWLELGIVERSDSPYCAQAVLVPKKDGSLRVCVDCRMTFRVETEGVLGDCMCWRRELL